MSQAITLMDLFGLHRTHALIALISFGVQANCGLHIFVALELLELANCVVTVDLGVLRSFTIAEFVIK